MKQNSYARLVKTGFFLILISGLALRCCQYFMGRSLWEDEAHLALNFMEHGYAGLAQPLDHAQAAPILFLYGVKTFCLLFGYGELALRALPFILSLLTLPLIYFILLELSQKAIVALTGFFLFSVNLAGIYFSSELKPYTVDLSAYLWLIYLTLAKNSFIERNRLKWLGVSGCLAILFSSTAFIVLFCIACSWVWNWYEAKKVSRKEFLILLCWLLVFVPNYFAFIYKHPATGLMKSIWSSAFCPAEILSHEFVDFIKKTFDETFFTLLLYASRDYYFPYLLLFLFFIAIRHLFISKNYKALFYTCLPVLAHLLLSAMQLYPFWYRFILYLMPCFIFIISLGLSLVFDFIRRKLHVSIALCFILACCQLLAKESIRQFPLWFREIKPAIEFANKQPADLHVYMSEPVSAYTYYYERGLAKKEIFRRIPWQLGAGELENLVDEKESNYLLFYIPGSFENVLQELKNKSLLLQRMEYKSYGVAVLKPFQFAADSLSILLNYENFDPQLIIADTKEIAIWEGSIASRPLHLKAGNYSLAILAKGSPVKGIYPLNQVYINGEKAGAFTSAGSLKQDTLSFVLKRDTNIVIKLSLENDASYLKEDRNTFIKSLLISPKK